MEYKKEKEEPQFDITDRGYNVKAFYLEEPKGEALIQVTKDGEMLREFLFPAYKIWNIAAHFKDLVDGEFEDLASSQGMGGGEMKGIRVRIIKATLPAWYEKAIGKTFNVRKKPEMYYGGMGYKCIDGGILVKDCEVVGDATIKGSETGTSFPAD